MPNWVMNEVTVKGTAELINLFKQKCFDDNDNFDFSKIIPTSERLCKLSSPPRYDVDIYIECGEDKKLIKEFLKKSKRKKKDISEILANMPQKDIDEAIEAGKIRIEEFMVHGCYDWYEFQCVHWGTKWNAGETNIYCEDNEELSFSFDTAWSCPYPIYEKLAKVFPLLKIDVQYCDEDVFGGNYGKFSMSNGNIEEYEMTQEEAAEFYYGDGWEEMFEDDETEDDDDDNEEGAAVS